MATNFIQNLQKFQKITHLQGIDNFASEPGFGIPLRRDRVLGELGLLELAVNCLDLDVGVVAPGVFAPGVVAPGVFAPGVIDPGILAPGVFAPGVVAPGVVLPLVIIARTGLGPQLLSVEGRVFADTEVGVTVDDAEGVTVVFLPAMDVLIVLLPEVITVPDLGLTGVATFAPLTGVDFDKVEDVGWRRSERGFIPVIVRRGSLVCDFRTLSFRPWFKVGILCLCGTALDAVAE